MPLPNRLTRRDFFVSLAALAVVAAVPLPIGLKTPFHVLKARADEYIAWLIVEATNQFGDFWTDVIPFPLSMEGHLTGSMALKDFRKIKEILVSDGKAEHAA